MSDISANFKDRFISSLPAVPPDLDLRFDEFVVFDANVIPVRLAKEDSCLLEDHGLPRDAAPFLSFHAYSQPEIESRKRHFGIPESYFPIGHNGSGDILAIDTDSREVVYFNHDNHNQRVFINSSVRQFAESLCIYQEHLGNRTMADCLRAIAAIDARAATTGSMWQTEVISELANEA
ncbi:SMI1/KNR4 family protein [Arenimonas sp. SCN 70-307]|uniref:SMI1/KNR4 family protein n=1 Tax=Arenimonas sp. SCN 70-307 TaxID=1660089 RepID=UPI0025BB51AB|nr:SMI1/KNR4 family protein [Arenimonas sp. SCN 70-307]